MLRYFSNLQHHPLANHPHTSQSDGALTCSPCSAATVSASEASRLLAPKTLPEATSTCTSCGAWGGIGGVRASELQKPLSCAGCMTACIYRRTARQSRCHSCVANSLATYRFMQNYQHTLRVYRMTCQEMTPRSRLRLAALLLPLSLPPPQPQVGQRCRRRHAECPGAQARVGHRGDDNEVWTAALGRKHAVAHFGVGTAAAASAAAGAVQSYLKWPGLPQLRPATAAALCTGMAALVCRLHAWRRLLVLLRCWLAWGDDAKDACAAQLLPELQPAGIGCSALGNTG